MPARCLIVDDEDLARQQLTRLLAAHPDFQVVGEACNGIEALELIPELQPGVVFLDIEMPGLSGFDMLVQLREGTGQPSPARRPVSGFFVKCGNHAAAGPTCKIGWPPGKADRSVVAERNHLRRDRG